MLQTLRNKTKIMMWIVAISFVGLIFIEWGMDFTGRGSTTVEVVGKVNGQEITGPEYQQALTNTRRMYAARAGGVSSDILEPIIEEQTWEQLVGEKLLRQEARRLKVEVTDADVLYQVQANPPPEVRQIEVFQTDGRFDPQKYVAALSDPGVDWTWLENYVRGYLPEQKLQERIWGTVVVTDQEARQEFVLRSETVTLKYVKVGARDQAEGDFQPDESALQAYLAAHPDDFRGQPRVRAAVATIPIAMTAADKEEAEDALKEAQAELASGMPFERVAEDYSGDPSADRGGDLGWISRGDLGETALENALFALAPGERSAPVLGARGHHIFQAVERDGERVHARQILIPIGPSEETVAEIEYRGRQLTTVAKKEGLAEGARIFSLPVVETEPFDLGSPPAPLRGVPEATSWLARAAKGDVGGPFRGDDAVIVVSVLDSAPGAPRTLAEARAQVREAMRLERGRERARRLAGQIAQRAAAAGLDAAAREAGERAESAGPFPRYQPPAELGAARAVVAMAFALPVGAISPAVEEGDDAYVFRVESRTGADEAKFAEQRAALMADILQRKRQAAFSAWFGELRSRAAVDDRRAELVAEAARRDAEDN